MVPADHLLRRLDAVLDPSWLHGELAPFYSHTGRASVDPEPMIGMPIVGYVFAIRSERRLCSEVRVNLAYRWFCGLSIEDEVLLAATAQNLRKPARYAGPAPPGSRTFCRV